MSGVSIYTGRFEKKTKCPEKNRSIVTLEWLLVFFTDTQYSSVYCKYVSLFIDRLECGASRGLETEEVRILNFFYVDIIFRSNVI